MTIKVKPASLSRFRNSARIAYCEPFMPSQNETKATIPMANDTIFAIASGAGRAGIAVLHLSGPATEMRIF
jgi:hypothetical protein